MSRRGLIWAAGAAGASALALIAALVIVMIVQGSDDDDPFADIPVPEGRVSCEAFVRADSYRWAASVTFFLEERPAGMDDSDGYGAKEFSFTQNMEGSYDHGAYEVVISTPVESESEEPAHIIVVGDNYWTLLNDVWAPGRVAEAPSFPVPYLPYNTCSAIAPDIFLQGVVGVPESVSEVSAHKYHFDELPTELPDRHASFGPQSDAARLIQTFSGDIWVADEGGYIIKFDMAGVGAHANGRKFSVKLSYDLSAINDKSVSVVPPA
jgi:hypothetical protein